MSMDYMAVLFPKVASEELQWLKVQCGIRTYSKVFRRSYKGSDLKNGLASITATS